MSWPDSIPFERLLWLVPVFFALHNLEEAPFMAAWSRRLPVQLPLIVTARQFAIAVTVLTLAGFAVTFLCLVYLAGPVGYLVILGIQAILAFNALIPHIAAAIRFRAYNPGLATAILITLPFSLYLFRRALSEQVLDRGQLWTLFGIAPFAMVIFAQLALQVGRILERRIGV